jgi:hypothetical protein
MVMKGREDYMMVVGRKCPSLIVIGGTDRVIGNGHNVCGPLMV